MDCSIKADPLSQPRPKLERAYAFSFGTIKCFCLKIASPAYDAKLLNFLKILGFYSNDYTIAVYRSIKASKIRMGNTHLHWPILHVRIHYQSLATSVGFVDTDFGLG